jgi:hypothetical protein
MHQVPYLEEWVGQDNKSYCAAVLCSAAAYQIRAKHSTFRQRHMSHLQQRNRQGRRTGRMQLTRILAISQAGPKKHEVPLEPHDL